MKALEGTFNQEKALVRAFSVIMKSFRTSVLSSSRRGHENHSGVLSVSVNGNVENNIIFVENFNQNLSKSMILVRGKVCCAEKVKKNIFFDPLLENIFRSESPLRVRSSAHTSQWSPN